MVRIAGFAAALCVAVSAFGLPAAAAPDFPLSTLLSKLTDMPDGWSRNMDGSFKHAQSGVICPMHFGSFNFEGIDGPRPDRPNILGVCRYRDGDGRTGAIRIRTYVEGWGSNMSIAENDKALMGPDAPPMMMRTSNDRNGGGRATVTVVRNGLLIDCSVWQASHDRPRGTFPLYCTTIPGTGNQ